MKHDRILKQRMTRRDFIWLMGVAGSAVALPPLLTGCATDPVTGQKTLVGMSEAQEIALDKSQSTHQFSADYGAYQDDALNRYLESVSQDVWKQSHRPGMPYNARVVNANYINAYTFPGGSMATTRGIMLEMQNEDELAALMGHETGHVNARHAAERAGKTLLVQGGLVLAQVAAANQQRDYQPIVNLAGQIGASALLAKYSRDNEREADALGMEYMARSGYSPEGMVGLMNLLQKESKTRPGLLETMFSSHPMSAERYQSAVSRSATQYPGERGRTLRRDRYMDHTAGLRQLKPAIAEMQQGENELSKGQAAKADTYFGQALRLAPRDYTANVLMAKAKIAQKKEREAEAYLTQARAIYPSEGQALQLSGVTKLALKQPDAALKFFEDYDRRLPGNAGTTFLKGVSYESMGNKKLAAEHYYRYAQTAGTGTESQYAVSRLKSWGYVK